MKAINWNEADQGMTFYYEDIPADCSNELKNASKLVEAAAEAQKN